MIFKFVEYICLKIINSLNEFNNYNTKIYNIIDIYNIFEIILNMILVVINNKEFMNEHFLSNNIRNLIINLFISKQFINIFYKYIKNNHSRNLLFTIIFNFYKIEDYILINKIYDSCFEILKISNCFDELLLFTRSIYESILKYGYRMYYPSIHTYSYDYEIYDNSDV